ncbi:hypothetical protein A7A08_02940 [Methyloligella halotolerans]|uniref:Autotransporter outer membrane beta-barrel domain-containing protein n=2 Tax=Methyloligella halotolerans TaxID=1177755 RepID=A0A1E2RVG4_9HYPH|nr:hypothetical protein A7A08_02940 [Methyloligella halotolerans]
MANSVKRQILLSTTMLAGALSGYTGRAYAACVNTSGSTYLCSGTEVVPQTINTANATVITDSTMDFNPMFGNALSIRSSGDVSYTDNDASTYLRSSNGVGLAVTNDSVGAGSTHITTAGVIDGGRYGMIIP